MSASIHNPKHRDEIVRIMQEALDVSPQARLYVTWVCPACGEKAACDEPNTFFDGGFTHTERQDGSACGETYHGENGYGLLAIFTGKGKGT